VKYTTPEYVNLATDADEDKLKEIGSMCLHEHRVDLDSRSEWESMLASWIDLFFMKDAPTNPPWEGSSKECIPMLLEACNQSHARAYSALFPGNKLVTAIPSSAKVGSGIRERIDRISAHMSYQLLVEDTHYKRGMDRLLLSLPLFGSMFTKTYYDPLLERTCTDVIKPTDLVIPYTVGNTNFDEIPRKGHIITLPMHKAAYLFRQGYFVKMPNKYDFLFDDDTLSQAADTILGNSRPNETTYCKLIEQHRFLDIDGDGLEEPYIVTLDATDGSVLRISIRYDVDEQGTPTDYKAPIEYFTDYQFIPNPVGTYGLGYGMLLGSINTSVNKLLRQIVDAGTLQNSGNMSGFVDRRLSIPGGILKLVLGMFTKVESSMDDISKGIYQFKFPGPSSVSTEVLRLLTLRGDRLAMVTETITGQAERVMQPTTVMALIEQAQILFGATQARVVEAWGHELNKRYRINGKYIRGYQQFMYSTTNADPMVMNISQADYADDMKVIPLADPKMSTKRERLALSDAEFQTGLQCPFITQNPTALFKLFARRFEAIGCTDIDEILPQMDPLMLAAMLAQAQMAQQNTQGASGQSQQSVSSSMPATSKQQEGQVQ